MKATLLLALLPGLTTAALAQEAGAADLTGEDRLVILVFGARRLPELGSGLGQAIKNFKKGLASKDEIDVTPKKEEVGEGEKPSS